MAVVVDLTVRSKIDLVGPRDSRLSVAAVEAGNGNGNGNDGRGKKREENAYRRMELYGLRTSKSSPKMLGK